jgi:SAM-dependent methyltransferase
MTFRARAARIGHTLFERLPAPARYRFRSQRDVFRGLLQLKRNQAMLASRVAQLEYSLGLARPAPSEPPDPRFPPGIRSRVCTQAQLREPWYEVWCEALGERPRANRKLWERAFIIHTLDRLDMLAPGRRGLGFGVGREPLVAFFAGRGCEILATDLAPTAKEARLWSTAHQHGGLDDLMRVRLCREEQFRKLVSLRHIDMRSLPSDLNGFDFCWSACALEHLGSLEEGLEFVRQSMRTLEPGGIAVHTTEFNVSSEDDTITSGPTVLYRRRDLEALSAQLEAAGHQVAALSLDPGSDVLDEYTDLPPYSYEPHLRIWLKNYATTSVALVVRAGPAAAR